MIAKLEGLEQCRQLQELYIGHQNLPKNQLFSFDEYSLAAISGTLRYLDAPSTQMLAVKPLYYLENLDVLNL